MSIPQAYLATKYTKGGFTEVEQPENFSFPIPVKVYNNGLKYTCDKSATDHKITDIVDIWYLSPDGDDDANDGTSWAQAWRTWEKLLSSLQTGVNSEVRLRPGTYLKSTFQITDCKLNIIGDTDVIIIDGIEGSSFTHASGNVYEATLANASAVFDLAQKDANGFRSSYESVADVPTCEATPGSYNLTGTTLSVHTLDSRAPDRFIAAVSSDGFAFSYGEDFFMQDVNFISHTYACHGNAGADVQGMLRCGFITAAVSGSYAYRGELQTNLQAIIEDCVSDMCGADNFAYNNIGEAADRWAIEINTKTQSGVLGQTFNGSSVHQGISIIRLSCEYRSSGGLTVHDVGDGHVWNLGCACYGSLATAPLHNVGFVSGVATDLTQMWLDNCSTGAAVPPYDYDMSTFDGTGANANVWYRNHTPATPTFPASDRVAEY